jgi:hypothetical protein
MWARRDVVWRRGFHWQFGGLLLGASDQLSPRRLVRADGITAGVSLPLNLRALSARRSERFDFVVMAGRRIGITSEFFAPGTPCCRRTCLLAVGRVWCGEGISSFWGVTCSLMLAKRAPGNITSPWCSNRSHQETSETDSNQKQAFSNRR